MKWCRFRLGSHVSFSLVGGDTIEVEISGIGTLRNHVMAER
jgi:2-keto-4-pentenoate hydratase/2-oxohepta-3-ene-1,7-dioic acid hydratase in catechol pathway